MIKQLQIKFVAIIMSIMTVVLLCVFGMINISMYHSNNRTTFETLKRIAESDGKMKNMDKLRPPKERLYDIPKMVTQQNFSVKLDTYGNVINIISDRENNYTINEISEYVEYANDSNEKYGNIGEFKFLIEQKSYGKIIVFLDNSIQINSAIRLFWISWVVVICGSIIIFIISIYLSNWAVKPVKKAYEAQKRFVSDASHELKTPLTVISANIDVLKSDIRDNKWLDFIKAETMRMNELVNNLLYLAKSDASENVYAYKDFDLSNAVISVSLPFESICFENHMELILDIEENIIYKGDEHKLLQVIIIFIDNAIKNTSINGKIRISLSQQNNKKIISVHNTGTGISEENISKIFERFYRGDASRARQTGGYGLGLSIAKTIIDAHKGKISVQSEEGKWAQFIVSL